MAEPTKREMDVLRALSCGAVEGRGGLPFIGTKTLSDMLEKGWIEEVPGGGVCGAMGYRNTSAGEVVRAAGRTPKPRKPVRLRTLESRLKPLQPRLR